jgi:hypothetical protein
MLSGFAIIDAKKNPKISRKIVRVSVESRPLLASAKS